MNLLADRPLRLLQPTRIPEIDWRNPLTCGLQMVFDGQSKAEVTRGKKFETSTGLRKGTSGGLGYEVVGATTVAQQPGMPFVSGTGATFYILVDHGTLSGSDQGLIGNGAQYNNTNFCVYASTAGALILFCSAASNSSSLMSTPSAGLHGFGVTYASGSATGYLDGAAKNTVSYTLTVPTAADTWLIGATATDMLSTEYLAGKFLLAAAWNRPLTVNEMRSLHANPWQIFKAPLRLLPSSGVAPQYLAPVSDVAAGSWLPSTGSDLYAMLDETSYSDTDYIYTTSATTATLGIASGGDPAVSTGHILRYRLLAGSGKIAVTLKQSSTTIASWGPHTLTGAAQDFAQTLTAGEADSITDYSALRVEFTSSLT